MARTLQWIVGGLVALGITLCVVNGLAVWRVDVHTAACYELLAEARGAHGLSAHQDTGAYLLACPESHVQLCAHLLWDWTATCTPEALEHFVSRMLRPPLRP